MRLITAVEEREKELKEEREKLKGWKRETEGRKQSSDYHCSMYHVTYCVYKMRVRRMEDLTHSLFFFSHSFLSFTLILPLVFSNYDSFTSFTLCSRVSHVRHTLYHEHQSINTAIIRSWKTLLPFFPHHYFHPLFLDFSFSTNFLSSLDFSLSLSRFLLSQKFSPSLLPSKDV